MEKNPICSCSFIFIKRPASDEWIKQINWRKRWLGKCGGSVDDEDAAFLKRV